MSRYWCDVCGNVQHYDTSCEMCDNEDFLDEIEEEDEDAIE